MVKPVYINRQPKTDERPKDHVRENKALVKSHKTKSLSQQDFFKHKSPSSSKANAQNANQVTDEQTAKEKYLNEMKDKSSRFACFVNNGVLDLPGPGHYDQQPKTSGLAIPTKAAAKIKRHSSIPQLKILKTSDPTIGSLATALQNNSGKKGDLLTVDSFGNYGVRRVIP